MSFVGDGLGQQGLSCARRPEQNDASRGLDAKVLEQFRLGQRPFHRFLQPVLDLQQATDGVPADFGNFDVDFTQGRRLNVPDGFFEVVHADLHLLEHLGRERLLVEVDFGQVPSQRTHGGLANKGGKVSTDKTVGVVEDPAHIEVVGDGHLTGVNVHDFTSALSVGHANLDFTVKAARASQGWVERIAAVGGADDHHVITTLHAVHEGQHLSDHASFNLTRDVLALGADGINFVNEHDGRSVVGRLVENLTKLFLGLTVVLRDDFWPVDALEVGVDFGGHRLGDHGLPRAGGPVKEDAFGRVDAETSEQFRVLERQLDHLTHFLKLLTDTANVFVGDALGLPNIFLGNGFVLDDDLGVGGHHNDALGDGLDHSKGQGLSEEGHTGDEDAVAGHDRTLGKTSLGEPFDAGSELDLLLVRHDG